MKDGPDFRETVRAMQVLDVLPWMMIRAPNSYHHIVAMQNRGGRVYRCFTHAGKLYVVRVE